jgi:hypothetical protein
VSVPTLAKLVHSADRDHQRRRARQDSLSPDRQLLMRAQRQMARPEASVRRLCFRHGSRLRRQSRSTSLVIRAFARRTLADIAHSDTVRSCEFASRRSRAGPVSAQFQPPRRAKQQVATLPTSQRSTCGKSQVVSPYALAWPVMLIRSGGLATPSRRWCRRTRRASAALRHCTSNVTRRDAQIDTCGARPLHILGQSVRILGADTAVNRPPAVAIPIAASKPRSSTNSNTPLCCGSSPNRPHRVHYPGGNAALRSDLPTYHMAPVRGQSVYVARRPTPREPSPAHRTQHGPDR